NLNLGKITVADPDSGANNIVVTLTASAGTLAATNSGSVTVGGSGTGTLTLTGTVTNLDNFLDDGSTIQYTTVSNAAGDSVATLTLTANDGGHTGAGGGLTVALGTINIDSTPVNDAPVVAHAIVDQSSPEDTAWTFQFAANTFSDVDGDTLSYTATLASGS